MQANSANSSSQSNPRSGAIDCSNPQTQQEMNQCAAQGYENADRELQAMYQQMQGQMSDNARSQLETAQKEWVEFRTAECHLEAKANEGGSMYPTVLYRCMERVTRDRMKQLQEQVNVKRQIVN
ncbi:lysozyme inhibitor LprI family protein [Leptolyngbya sp. FACHB-711]|uniref:lysozyme inhibitor LprI family protein n=1 Tax=unclassified Leptolyngbya TaxID=2650499 RepID=UPI001685072D|nr:lysozyme inhibitor LprI family protein [Leptolyngbya sp. FACHB-711]MBD1850444.1 DUF1311 domain-containing protein [Cyanobacteria bacterium FACHB-502]MBD2025186.1 DUF1311 domain-containing protein [Leptolyngbya sp. FACHB-711]